MKVPFVGASNEVRSTNADTQRTVNCYLELDNASPRAPIALYGMPGLVSRFTLPSARCRGSIAMGEYTYMVAGDAVYRISVVAGAYVVTSIGNIASNTGPVSMAQNGEQVLIVDGVNGWLATPTTFGQVADADFPNGVRQCTSQDGYFIATGNGTQRFYINETPRDGSTWNGTDFASAEGSPDLTIGCISDHRELWLFGAESAEPWVNTGQPDFPFSPSGNTFVEQGCAAASSIVAMDNTVFVLGRNQDGVAMVFRYDGYTPKRISSHAIEEAMQGYSTVSDAIGFTFQIIGHSFYVLTFPTADHTWVYDASTGEWIEWLWWESSTNTYHRHRAACCVFFNGEHLVGDWQTGEVYALDLDTYDDAGDTIKRLRITQTTADTDNFSRLFFPRLQVDAQTGVGINAGQGSAPLLMLRYSNDGGNTWSNYRTASLGAMGQYGRRLMYSRLGSGRDRVWELSLTDPVRFAVFGAAVDVERGTQ